MYSTDAGPYRHVVCYRFATLRMLSGRLLVDFSQFHGTHQVATEQRVVYICLVYLSIYICICIYTVATGTYISNSRLF